jgi:hypothetical protein
MVRTVLARNVDLDPGSAEYGKSSDVVVVERDAPIVGGLTVGYFFRTPAHLAAARWKASHHLDRLDLAALGDDVDLEEIDDVLTGHSLAGEQLVFEGSVAELLNDAGGAELRSLWREHLAVDEEDDADEDFDEDEDESAADDPVVDAYEMAHFVVRRALAELKKLGAELELEESPTKCLGMEGYGVEGSTKRRLLVGKNTLASWEQGIYGESQQFGTGLWVTKGETCADRGSFVPADSFLERNGLELSHPGFPTDHWEALEWAGVGDEDEDDQA